MSRDVTQKRIEFNQEDLDWFEVQYPKGSLSAVVSMLFTKFREANTFTPADYAKIAAEALSEELKSK